MLCDMNDKLNIIKTLHTNSARKTQKNEQCSAFLCLTVQQTDTEQRLTAIEHNITVSLMLGQRRRWINTNFFFKC